jgi:hypothetical protein
MIRLIFIIALAFLGIFVNPFQPGVWDFVFRFLVFVLIIYLLFNSGFLPGRKREDLPADQHHRPVAGACGGGPGAEVEPGRAGVPGIPSA